MVLVAQGASGDFNPDLPQSVVDKALARDPLANKAEFLAECRTDVESLLTIESVNAVIDPGVKERAPDLKHSYVAFVDPSGGSSDSMTLAIAHKEGETEVLDLIRERKPPFSPEAVVEEFAATKGGSSPRAKREDEEPNLSRPASAHQLEGCQVARS
jgi:hypothetical protein